MVDESGLPPDYGTAPDAELEHPRSPAFLVFRPWAGGAATIVGFGPDQRDEARNYARITQGICVRAGVIADYR